MIKKALTLSVILMTGTALSVAVAPVEASGQLPIYEACLAKAETASDKKTARDQCVWNHWDLMAEYGR